MPHTLADLLRDLATSDPTRPRLTWYDDAPGPTRGERIELSGRVLANWAAKAANWLQEDLDAGPGTTVVVDLPTHWRAAYWLMATWQVGALAVVPTEGERVDGADVLVTDRPERADEVAPGAEVVAVSLPALARSWAGPGPLGGAADEAAQVASFGDVHVPFTPPGPQTPALRVGGTTRTHRDLLDEAEAVADGLGHGARVLSSRGPADVAAWLSAWVVDGSLVLVRDPDVSAVPARREAEQVTAER